MAEINASFIPKKDIGKRKRRGGGGFSVNIFLLISIVIFLTAIFASLGVFLWEKNLAASNQQSLAELEKNRDNYGLAAIEEYIELSNRIGAVERILDNHISVTKVFDLLEQSTLTEVVISNFSFDGALGERMEVNARGSAPSFEHVAYQAEVYADEKDIKDLILSGVDQNREGGVSFDISFAVDHSFLRLQ